VDLGMDARGLGGHGCENFCGIGFRVAELLPLFGCTWCDGD